MPKPLRSTGQLRRRLGAEPSAQAFQSLFEALCEAERAGVPELPEWVSLAEQTLSGWPASLRCLEWRVDPDEEGRSDRFLTREHALYSLPRALYIEEDSLEPLSDYLHAFFQAPEARRITHLDLTWFSSAPSPEELKAFFGPARGLVSLSLWFEGLSDAHAQALGACEGLASLLELKLSGHALRPAALRELSQAPVLRSLRRFLIGESAGDVQFSGHPEHLGEGNFEGEELLALRARMPDLEMLLAVHSRVPLGAVAWSQGPAAAQEECFGRVLKALQDPEEPYPFDEESAAFRWLEPGEALEEDPDWQEWTQAFGLGFADGPPLFVKGMLAAPVAFRTQMRGVPWPHASARSEEDGACLHQVHFAQAGLVLDREADGLLWLRPERCDEGSDLLRFFAALASAEAVFGGRNVDYACSPWHEVMGGVVDSYGVRCIVGWAFDAHAFGATGRLSTQGQRMFLRGDPFPLLHALERVGLTLVGQGSEVVLQSLVGRRSGNDPQGARQVGRSDPLAD